MIDGCRPNCEGGDNETAFDGNVHFAMTSEAQDEISIPPLVSGGLFLSYRCRSECRHCLYQCSPRQPDEWMSIEMAERIFAALAKEPHIKPVHIGGGEPGMRLGLLEEVIRLATAKGVPVSYVQTNGFWCTDPAETRGILGRLKDAGLEKLYVSVSMFHNEYVPFKHSRICVEAAREVFGPSNVTFWSPAGVDMYEVLSRMPDDGTHSLGEFRRWACEADAGNVLPAVLKEMIPRGRIIQTLGEFYERLPAESFRDETCLAELLSTESSGTIFHYHIDHCGNLVMGCCAGLSPATVEDLHPRITIDTHPVFYRVCAEGPSGLMRMAVEQFGYEEKEKGYISKCDLCFDVRRRLKATGCFPELRPASIYEV